MSTSNPRDESRRASLGKYVKRVSSVFRRTKSDKDGPTLATTPVLPTGQQAQIPKGESTKQDAAGEEDAIKGALQDEAAVVETAKEEITSTIPAMTQTTPATLTAPTHPLGRTVMQQERARALFAKHGLTLDPFPSDPILIPVPAPSVQRVEKPIRMRIHRSCHHCGTLYGSEKKCASCSHTRCKNCPRYPDKKKAPEPTKGKEKEISMDRAWVEKPRRQPVLTTKSKSGKEITFRPPTQRVRRTCHKCQTLFIPPTATTCAQCSHTRCTKCPRDPPKRNKWPTTYPGDVDADTDSEPDKHPERLRRVWRKPRMRVRWHCEACQTLFGEGEKQCNVCGHQRCYACIRSPPKTIRRNTFVDPDDEGNDDADDNNNENNGDDDDDIIVTGSVEAEVEEKLKALDVGE